MKNLRASLAMSLIISSLLVLFQPIVFAATTPSLRASTTYGVLANTYTDTSAATTINGDVGFTTPPATPPAGVHTNYGSGAPYPQAGIDQGSALTALAAEPCTFTFAPGAIDLSTDATHGPIGVYTPGVYCSTGAMNVGGPMTLSGNGTYIFRPVGALTSAAGAVVTLSNSSSCDVFWTPTAATTLAANTTFFGTVIDDAGITVGANTSWLGRALAFGGTVTTDTNTITVPNCLRVVKQVVNDNGGLATAAAFNLHVKQAGIDVAGSPIVGTVTPGFPYTLSAGAYVVSEDINTAYTPSFSGACDAGGNVTLSTGDDKTCTITNDDIAPQITVTKVVVNDSGGVKVIANFPLAIDAGVVASGIASTTTVGLHTVSETVDPLYTSVISGDCAADGTITLVVGDIKFCIITNDDITPVVVSSGDGGGSVILPPPVPPLIDVVKVPDPLALPGGPGLVKYTYTLRNIGTVPVTNITMVGDTCIPIVLISGDTNNDNMLNVDEVWVHTCQTTLTKTHTNTIVATGWANGISAVDIASATVIVGLSAVPPLIHVTKIPNIFTLDAGGDLVTYTETVTNPGIVALSNVVLTDDKCSPVTYISGDTNLDTLLDPSESWVYICRSNLTKTTTNTALATGEANGITVKDFAIVTVVVAPGIVFNAAPELPTPTVFPGFPNTGVAPEGKNSPWNFVILGSIIAIISIFIVRQKIKS